MMKPYEMQTIIWIHDPNIACSECRHVFEHEDTRKLKGNFIKWPTVKCPRCGASLTCINVHVERSWKWCGVEFKK
jgi:hypothetical protein